MASKPKAVLVKTAEPRDFVAPGVLRVEGAPEYRKRTGVSL